MFSPSHEPMPNEVSPVVIDAAAPATVRLQGAWNLAALAPAGEVRRRQQLLRRAQPQSAWDLTGITVLDSVGALVLWRHWGQRLPAAVQLGDAARDMFALLAEHPTQAPVVAPADRLAWVVTVGQGALGMVTHLRDVLVWFGQVVIELLFLILRPHRGPWRELSAQVYRVGAQALGITALVGFLIGVVLSYLSAQQLQLFGASVYIVNLLGVAVVRELGPVLAAILVAGRSGSAITAQLGVMRVTQELDALSVMGISHGQRLVLPRVLALMLAMPLLVLWTDAMALLGGMLVAAIDLQLSPSWFISALREAISLTNFWIGLGKGVLFGLLIGLVACHHGMRIQPNTESLGRGTTASVVASITAVILADAVCAVIFSELGW